MPKITLLLPVLLVWLLVVCSLAAQAMAKPNTLTVVGHGVVVTAAPTSTVGRVSVGITVKDPSPSACMQEGRTLMNNIIDSLKAAKHLGVTHLQTSNFGFAPLSHWEHGATGYGLRNSVSFQTPVEFTGEAIDLAITSGAHVVEDVRLITSSGAPVNTHKYYMEAQALALDDALEQGKAILEKLNCQWDGIYAIVADAPNMGYPMAKMAFAQSREFDAASPIVSHNEGEEVRASMTVQFSYSKCAL